MPQGDWIFMHFVPTLGFILAFLLLAHILTSQRSSASTFAWLLAIVFIPHFAVPLYILFGGRKLKRMAERKEKFPRPEEEPADAAKRRKSLLPGGVHGIFPPHEGNALEVLSSGEEAYQKLMQILKEATRSIYVTTYLLKRDETGKAILELLVQKASVGVKVYLLLDALGSFKLKRRHLKALRKAGGRYAYFMPMMRLPFQGRANLRNHRKMILVDGRVAIMGGMNLAYEYMGPGWTPSRWRDLCFCIQGPVLEDLKTVFASDWSFASGETLQEEMESPSVFRTVGEVPLQLMPSGPDVEGDPLHEAIVSCLFAAKSRIWIVTPYFIPDEMLLHALCIAARRGIDVRLIIPKRSNHPLADFVRSGYLRALQRAGARICVFQEGMIHGKLILIDEGLAISGSANMDIRSLFLNYEIGLFVHSTEKVTRLEIWVEAMMQQCTTGVKENPFGFEVVEGLGRLFAPLL